MTVRKKILLDEKVVEHLKKIAEKNQTTQTQVVWDMIEDKDEEISVEEKLEALKGFVGSGTGLFGELTIQEIKASMDV